VKYKRILVGSLLCIMLSSMILIGAWALFRISMAYNYAVQYAAAAPAPPPTVTSSTNMSVLIYADPEGGRQALNLFQYVTAQNIEWRGTSTDPQGNPININVKMTSVNFEKLDENNYRGNVKGLVVRFSIGDLINVFVKADNVNVSMAFWNYMDTFPAFNATGLLTGNVEVRLSIAVLPFMGLEQALYEYAGDQFSISYCIIKPIDVTIEKPSNGEKVNGDVKIQALVKAVPALTVDNVHCWVDGMERPVQMQYNPTSGLWEGVWQTYNVGNGWRGLNVRAEGVEWKSGQQFRYSDQDRIDVEIDNPWVSSYVRRDWGLEWFGDLKVNLVCDSASWMRGTTFNFWPSIGLSLTAPEYYWDGNIRFTCWRIDDKFGTPLYESYNPTLTIDEAVFSALFDGEGRARELKCIYEQVPPPPPP